MTGRRDKYVGGAREEDAWDRTKWLVKTNVSPTPRVVGRQDVRYIRDGRRWVRWSCGTYREGRNLRPPSAINSIHTKFVRRIVYGGDARDSTGYYETKTKTRPSRRHSRPFSFLHNPSRNARATDPAVVYRR